MSLGRQHFRKLSVSVTIMPVNITENALYLAR